jgi:hypothetical protein
MASLRKKRDVVSTPEAAPAVEAEIEASPPPSVEPSPEQIAPPQDEAALALQAQLDAIRQGETMQEQAQIAALAAQERRQAWVESNPLANKHYAALNDLHHEAMRSGLADTSPDYFDFLNNRLADLDARRPEAAAAHLAKEMQARARPQPQEQAKPTRLSAAHMSAPVSRQIPSGGIARGGRITLTLEQREAARLSGITEAEYAKQLLRLCQLQAAGEYSDRR